MCVRRQSYRHATLAAACFIEQRSSVTGRYTAANEVRWGLARRWKQSRATPHSFCPVVLADGRRAPLNRRLPAWSTVAQMHPAALTIRFPRRRGLAPGDGHRTSWLGCTLRCSRCCFPLPSRDEQGSNVSMGLRGHFRPGLLPSRARSWIGHAGASEQISNAALPGLRSEALTSSMSDSRRSNSAL